MLPVTAKEPVPGLVGNGLEGSKVNNLEELINVLPSFLISSLVIFIPIDVLPLALSKCKLSAAG